MTTDPQTPDVPIDVYHLQRLAVPDASSDATARIMEQARANPRRVWRWLALWRQFRAFFYVPQTRYVVMASIVGFFIVVGLFTQRPVPMPLDNDLLIDVTFESETPLDDFWG